MNLKTQNTNSSENNNLSQKLFLIVIVIVMVMGAYYYGSFTKELKIYKDLTTGKLTADANKPSQDGGIADTNAKNVPREVALEKPNSNDHILGNKNAKIALVEYSDYDCPFCGKFHETAKQLIEENADVMWVYRHFPLETLHPNSKTKSIASECVASLAGEDAFWKFTDYLLANPISVAELSTAAVTQTGVDKASFDNCLNNQDTIAKVDNDISTAVNAGVSGTPGNFILDIETGKALPLAGAVPLATVKTTIEMITQ